MKSVTRNGDDRRTETRGPDRRGSVYDIRTICRIMAENTNAISALLSFPPMMLAVDADSARAKAADLADRNSFLVRLLPYAS
jgi:hypothetical protein